MDALNLLAQINNVNLDGEYDTVLRNGKIMSPGDIETGEANVNMIGDVAIATPCTLSGKDCTGLVVSPGFIHLNCHDCMTDLQLHAGLTTTAGFESASMFSDHISDKRNYEESVMVANCAVGGGSFEAIYAIVKELLVAYNNGAKELAQKTLNMYGV